MIGDHRRIIADHRRCTLLNTRIVHWGVFRVSRGRQHSFQHTSLLILASRRRSSLGCRGFIGRADEHLESIVPQAVGNLP